MKKRIEDALPKRCLTAVAMTRIRREVNSTESVPKAVCGECVDGVV
jgi:hypothetical protein